MRHIRTPLVDRITGETLAHAHVAPNIEPAALEALTAMAEHIHVRVSLGLPISKAEYEAGTRAQRACWDRVWREWQECQGANE